MSTSQTPIPEPRPGLYDKYLVIHTDGTPARGDYFVLKMDDPATAPAMRAYAAATDNEKFAADLRERFGVTESTALTDQQREALVQLVAYWDGDPIELDNSPETAYFRALFPEVFAEPEPGADIPDEVVGAAASAYAGAYDEYTYSKLSRDRKAFRAAIAAADAKRDELMHNMKEA